MEINQLIILLFLGLIIFKPEDLPAVARSFGKIVHQIRGASREFEREIKTVINESAKPASGNQSKPKSNLESEPETEPDLDHVYNVDLNEAIPPKIELADLPQMIQHICSQAAAQAISYDTLTSGSEYRAIIKLRDAALAPLLLQLCNSQSDGLEEYVIAMACSEIITHETTFDYSSGKAWYRQVAASLPSKKIELQEARAI